MNREFISSIEEIIKDQRAGKMVIMVDDEDRENEGDLIIPAEKTDDKAVNFCLLYTSPSPRDRTRSRMPSSA